MKKALVEQMTGRIAQVVATDKTFPVAPGLSWIDCPDNISADSFQFVAGQIVEKPAREEPQPNREQKLLALLQEKGIISADEAKLV